MNADKVDRVQAYPRTYCSAAILLLLRNNDWEKHLEEGALDDYLKEMSGAQCEIMRFVEKDCFYTVVILEPKEDDPTKVENLLVEHLPRAAIQYADWPYTSNTFLRNSPKSSLYAVAHKVE